MWKVEGCDRTSLVTPLAKGQEVLRVCRSGAERSGPAVSHQQGHIPWSRLSGQRVVREASMWAERYLEELMARLKQVQAAEGETMAEAAEAMAEAVSQGGMIYVFGCGHSAALSMDIFYRAGGLMLVQPISDERVLLHWRPVTETSEWERKEGWAPKAFAASGARAGDVVIVISTSGRNGAPVDMALAAKAAGVKVIGITSRAYAGSLPPRHSSGKRLHEIVDIVIDNHSSPGDAEITLPGLEQKVGPMSTAVGAAILQGLVVETVAKLLAKGERPPIFVSANLPGGDEHNQAVLARYRDRIGYL